MMQVLLNPIKMLEKYTRKEIRQGKIRWCVTVRSTTSVTSSSICDLTSHVVVRQLDFREDTVILYRWLPKSCDLVNRFIVAWPANRNTSICCTFCLHMIPFWSRDDWRLLEGRYRYPDQWISWLKPHHDAPSCSLILSCKLASSVDLDVIFAVGGSGKKCASWGHAGSSEKPTISLPIHSDQLWSRRTLQFQGDESIRIEHDS